MKLLIKMVIALLGLWLAFFLVYGATIIWDQIAAKKKTTKFLDAIQAQQYEEALNWYGGSRDEMLMVHEERDFKLLSFNNVKADFDDGCVCTGHTNLTFEVDRKLLQVSAILTFSSDYKPKQVCAIHPSGAIRDSIPELETWNRIFCGGGSF